MDCGVRSMWRLSAGTSSRTGTTSCGGTTGARQRPTPCDRTTFRSSRDACARHRAAACVLAINADPVSIKLVEQAIADRAFDEGWIVQPPETHSGLRVAVVGSGPGGLAAAQQLTRVGHATVFERSDRIEGLVRYGIPDFKMDKSLLDRRLGQMAAEGTRFRAGVDVGVDITVEELRSGYDATVLATGALAHREVPVPGRHLDGVHFAMPYLELANTQVQARRPVGAGRANARRHHRRRRHRCRLLRHRAAAGCRIGPLSCRSMQPPAARTADQPWPTIPLLFTVAAVHEEGGERVYAVNTEEFVDDGPAACPHCDSPRVAVSTGSGSGSRTRASAACDLALLAIGFSGPERGPLLDGLGVSYTPRGTVRRRADYRALLTGPDAEAAPVFVAGDAGCGASLIVWAIAEDVLPPHRSTRGWGRTALPSRWTPPRQRCGPDGS